MGNGASPNDLLDQRDQALTQLSGYFDVTTQTETDGTLTVRTKSGATLVSTQRPQRSLEKVFLEVTSESSK